jgi:hypothetical protein
MSAIDNNSAKAPDWVQALDAVVSRVVGCGVWAGGTLRSLMVAGGWGAALAQKYTLLET